MSKVKLRIRSDGIGYRVVVRCRGLATTREGRRRAGVARRVLQPAADVVRAGPDGQAARFGACCSSFCGDLAAESSIGRAVAPKRLHGRLCTSDLMGVGGG
jgi:hypothetical protein